MPAALLLALLLSADPPAASDQPPTSEELPAPRESEPEALPPPRGWSPGAYAPPAVSDLDPMYLRKSHYSVWQYYAVDRQNQWRPLVVYVPAGAFYVYNGAPFLWAETRPREWDTMMYAGD